MMSLNSTHYIFTGDLFLTGYDLLPWTVKLGDICLVPYRYSVPRLQNGLVLHFGRISTVESHVQSRTAKRGI